MCMCNVYVYENIFLLFWSIYSKNKCNNNNNKNNNNNRNRPKLLSIICIANAATLHCVCCFPFILFWLQAIICFNTTITTTNNKFGCDLPKIVECTQYIHATQEVYLLQTQAIEGCQFLSSYGFFIANPKCVCVYAFVSFTQGNGNLIFIIILLS